MDGKRGGKRGGKRDSVRCAPGSKLAAATAWLRMLAPGPQRATAIRQAARAAGISDRTLDRSKRLVGVTATRRGGLGRDGWWTWEIGGTGRHAVGASPAPALCWNPRCRQRLVEPAARYCVQCGWPSDPRSIPWPLIAKVTRHPAFDGTGRQRAAVQRVLRGALQVTVLSRGRPAAVRQWLGEQVSTETVESILPTGCDRDADRDAVHDDVAAVLNAIAVVLDETTGGRVPGGQNASILPRVVSPEQQVVLTLLDTDMWPHQIARVLGMTSNAVRQTRHRKQRAG